jgi:thiamine biosynthesis lipoprotein
MISRAALALLIVPSGLAATVERMFESVEPHMGTLVRIEIYTTSEARAKTAFRSAFARIAALDTALSDYNPGSELNRVCRSPAGAAVPVSADLFRVLAAGQRLARQTGGAFDVTIGPLTHLWRAARAAGSPPTPEAIADAKARTGFTKLRLDREARTATLAQSGMQLDVGGIGKGYAADEALRVLTRLGIRRALVAMSGDLAFSNPPPGKRGWKIATTYSTLELANGAVSTSGDTEQHLDQGSRRYSHIVNPATGMGLTNSHDISVIARRGIDADALATAASIIGPDPLGCAAISKSEIDCSARPSIDAIPRPKRPDHSGLPSNRRPKSATPYLPRF